MSAFNVKIPQFQVELLVIAPSVNKLPKVNITNIFKDITCLLALFTFIYSFLTVTRRLPDGYQLIFFNDLSRSVPYPLAQVSHVVKNFQVTLVVLNKQKHVNAVFEVFFKNLDYKSRPTYVLSPCNLPTAGLDIKMENTECCKFPL